MMFCVVLFGVARGPLLSDHEALANVAKFPASELTLNWKRQDFKTEEKKLARESMEEIRNRK
jgi:hypothetical protein